jgi:hypothetical protein
VAEEAHSLFSASGSDAWGGPCPGKPAMEKGRKTTSEYADEGTAAHELLKWCAEETFATGQTKSAQAYLGRKIEVVHETPTGTVKRTFTVDSEMASYVDDVLAHFLDLTDTPGAVRMAEQRVYYHAHLGVPRELAFGTADLSAVLFDQPELELYGRVYPAGDELVVDDLKYGKGVLVEADTMQLRLYAVGVLFLASVFADVVRVRLVIHQPRKDHVDEVLLTVPELLAEVAELRRNVPAVIEAMAVADECRAAGKSDLEVGRELDQLGFLGASDKACRFCDAKAVCPVQIGDVSEAVSGRRTTADEFEDLTVDAPAAVREYGGNYLAHAYLLLDRIEGWAAAVRKEMEARVLVRGEKIDAAKVVLGAKPRRSWTDKGEVELMVSTMPKPVQDLVFKRELKTPKQALDALKTSPLWLTKLAGLVHQPEAKKIVVPAHDARPAADHKAGRDDFEDLTADQPAAGAGAAAGRDRHPFR